MDPLQILMGGAVVAAWTALGVTIRRWGPGRRFRSVRCPNKKVRARVEVEQREGDFGSLRVADIHRCSLIPNAPGDCGKECLGRF